MRHLPTTSAMKNGNAVSDTTHDVSKFKSTLFADDTVLFLGKSVIDLKNVNEALNYIDHWLKHNELFLNYTKIHYMLITKNTSRL